jgi:Uma2 family endonuclease
MVAQPARRLFTVDEYYRMAEAGILGEDDRVELIKGEILAISPIGSLNASCVNRLNLLLDRLNQDRAILSVQGPLRLNNRSEPVPDGTLLAPRDDFYVSGHPGPGDVRLLIEVSDTTLAYDSGIKLRLYSRSGIAEVWIVDLQGQCITVYRNPTSSGYQNTEVHERGGRVAVASFPDIEFAIDDVLG